MKAIRNLRFSTLPLGVYVFAGVLLLRLLVLARLTESPFLLPAQGDMHFYNEWALRILRGEFTDHRAFYGLPLYPYLLAAIYKLFGFSPFIPGLIQAGLEGGTGVIIFKIGARVFGDRGLPAGDSRGRIIGPLAAAGWGFYLPAQSYSVIMMPTSWLLFVFWWLVWQIIKRDSAPSLRALFLFGLLIGFTAMGIATILFLLPLLFAALLLKWRVVVAPLRRGAEQRPHSDAAPWLHWAGGIALLFLGVGIGTSPAWLHNRFVANDPVFLSAHSGVNFWIGNNPTANGYPRFPPGLRAGQTAMLADSITGAEAAAGHPLKRSEVSAYWSAKAKAYIADNPAVWLGLLWVKIANFWNAFQYDDLSIITSLREEGVTLPGIRFGIVAALALPGILLATLSIPASRWILAAVLLHMVSLLGVFVTERYRLAAVPGLLLFAAFGLWTLWRDVSMMQFRRTAIYGVLLALAVWFVSVRRGDAELWALDPYNSGLHALEANHLKVAERKLNLAYAYVPGNAEVNFALGNLHYARGDREQAKSYYGRTLGLDPCHEGALNNLGVLALEEQQWEAAIKFFETALALAPQDAKTHYLLARALLGSGDKIKALCEVKIAIRLDPHQPAFVALRDDLFR